MVRSWEQDQFVETRTADGTVVAMKDIPNVGYHAINIVVNE